MLTETDLIARRLVWDALSSLFLDTDTALLRVWRAKTLAESPFEVTELEQILFDEVYPACVFNLLSVAGEWSGFNLDWLEGRITRRQRSGILGLRRTLNLGRVTVHCSTEWRATKQVVERLRGGSESR